MTESRYECSWCHEISADGDGLPPEASCTGQPSHAAHVWIEIQSALRSRLPFENERRFAPERILTNA
jgi:hypothetical protein